jgi:hypothetical protein
LLSNKKKSANELTDYVQENIVCDYLTPCIIFINFLFKAMSNIPQAITKIDTYKKIFPAPRDSTLEAKKPPKMLATKEDSSHTPIKTEANFGGDNLVTTERPTGDKNSSPMVWIK